MHDSASRLIDLLVLAAVMALLAGCPPGDDPTPSATDPAAGAAPPAGPPIAFVSDAGLLDQEVIYDNGEADGTFAIVESLGGGVGVLDFDNDGRDDLVIPGGGRFDDQTRPQPLESGGVRLLRQTGRDGDRLLWEDVTGAAGLGSEGIGTTRHYVHGAACCDYDNDGFRDVLLTGYGGVQLLRNRTDGTFEDVTDASGLDADTLWSSSAAWGDLNRDGRADLYITHYVNWSPENDPYCGTSQQQDVCAPKQFDPLPDAVFLQQPDGTFARAAVELPPGKGLAVMLADLDGDRDLDVLVANDTTPNFFLRNDTPPGGELVLVEEGQPMGLALDDMSAANGSMGIALTDFNNDTRPDLWVTNFESELFALYRNEGVGGFTHVSRRLGINRIGTLMVSFGCVAGDFDADGDEDVAIANGHIVHHPTNAPLRQKPVLLTADGGKFVRAEPGGYFSEPHLGRGLATGDFDRDGRLDLVYAHTLEPYELLLNRTPTEGETRVLRLVGTVDAREPAGTAVVATLASGRTLYRQLAGGTSYLSSSSPIIHLAWPSDDPLRSIEVRWPSTDPVTLPADALVPGDTGEVVITQGE